MERRKEREKQAMVQWRPDINPVTGVPEGQSIFNDMQYNHQPNSDRRIFGLENIPGLYNMSCSQLLALANNTVGKWRPDINPVTGVPQGQSIFNDMQYNHQPNSDRRRFGLENIPGLYNMSCSQLLALANNTVCPSLPSSSSLCSYFLTDSWIPSWNMETNPWFLNPGSSIGINSGFLTERTMQTPQYDVSTPHKLIYDLNLPPEEILSTSLQPTEPEFITLDTPYKRLSETHQAPPHNPIKESFLENGSSSGVKKGKRARDDEKNQLKTPALKRKKIRPKVVSEGKPKRVSSKAATTKSSVAVAAVAATATKTSEESSHVRPKRSSKRSLRYDLDFVNEDYEHCGLDFPLEGPTSGEKPTDTTSRIFGNIPKRSRQKRTNPIRIITSSEKANACLSSLMTLVNTRPTTTFMESKEDLPSYSKVSQGLGRNRSDRGTRARKFKELVQSNVPIKWDKHPANFYKDRLYSTLPTKKRGQRDPIASQINARILSLQWQRLNPKGTSFADMWERTLTIQSITKLFGQLDINREGPYVPHNKDTALMLHKKGDEERQAIVKYSKKKKLRVQMDSETNRVWKLLMSSGDSDGVDGTDEEKRIYWDEERSMFHDRSNSFIARMSKVQGDRTFSPWKGSVVDSVVGVFLTQAVADHSSSSAYMDLAARFPVDWDFYKGSSAEELGSSVTHETVTSLCPRNAVSTPIIRNPNGVIIEEIDDDDDDNIDALSSQESSKTIDALSSQESSKTSDSSISSTNQSKMMLLNPFHTDGHIPDTDGLDVLSNGMVSSTSPRCDLNLNEVPPEAENYDTFINQANEDSRVQYISNHQQELVNTLQAENQDKNTRTEYNKKDKKRSTTSRPVDQPPKNKSKESTKKKAKEPAKRKAKQSAKSKLEETIDWDILRKQAESGGKKRERTERTMDTVDWEALRSTSVNKIAGIIRKRGMNNMLAERIKAFLDRLVEKHGSIDLEWLRDVPPKKAKDYLLSINGLGLKSVECVRLLSLRQVAFPVDTNVGRIAVRLGWVPLQPLPDELQMHLLELYPDLDSVQKYLWPRLCKLDQKTLYELHYHMITFGKVFCTKKKPNCNACPMKSECRHYASATTSAQLALPEPEESERTSVMIHEYKRKPFTVNFQPSFLTHGKEQVPTRYQNCEPIIEEPTSPEAQYTDIEDYPWDSNNSNDLISRIIESGSTSKDPCEDNDLIPTIILNKEAETSKDLVVVSTQAASIPGRKLKVTERLRTEHHVYELPDDHFVLEEFEKREEEDNVPYLLAILTPGETADSIEPPKQRCVFQGNNTLCHENQCFECNKIREEGSKIVRGTILIPCRTAVRGGFPLNGTYFQTNEVFADHGSSIKPIAVPRDAVWKLPRRVTYFGSSVTSICRGLSMADITENFEEGYVCERGFNRENRAPMPLEKRLHYTASKQEPSREPKQVPERRGRKPSKYKLP